MINSCFNIYFWLCGLYSNDFETCQTWKYGISKATFMLKSSTAIVVISYGTVPKQAELKNTCMNECNDPKHQAEKNDSQK